MKFEKIPPNRYVYDVTSCDDFSGYCSWDDLKLPRRATRGSAGYDIFSPTSFTLSPGETIKFATGIRVLLDEDKCLVIVPRSGLGFKYRTQLWNTLGVIDSDYSNSENYGHIWVKMINESDKVLEIKQGEAFCQGIILQYFKVDGDTSDGERNGGFGSTDS